MQVCGVSPLICTSKDTHPKESNYAALQKIRNLPVCTSDYPWQQDPAHHDWNGMESNAYRDTVVVVVKIVVVHVPVHVYYVGQDS
jgi:hypothetical protein